MTIEIIIHKGDRVHKLEPDGDFSITIHQYYLVPTNASQAYPAIISRAQSATR